MWTILVPSHIVGGKYGEALGVEQILEGMRQLSDDEKRELASGVLSDPKLEAFVEELDDNLTCERAVNELSHFVSTSV